MWEQLKKPTPTALDRRQSLAGIPVLNRNVELVPRDDGRLLVRVTVQRGPGLLSRFLPAHRVHQYRLDELGAFVIRQIDGQRSAVQIIAEFTARFKTNRREAELSVVEFLRMLTLRQVISLVIK